MIIKLYNYLIKKLCKANQNYLSIQVDVLYFKK